MANFAKHGTLVAATLATVTLAGTHAHSTTPQSFEIANEAASGAGATSNIYFSVDGSVPTVGGDDTYVCYPGQAKIVPAATGQVIKLISAGTPAYSVTAVLG